MWLAMLCLMHPTKCLALYFPNKTELAWNKVLQKVDWDFKIHAFKICIKREITFIICYWRGGYMSKYPCTHAQENKRHLSPPHLPPPHTLLLTKLPFQSRAAEMSDQPEQRHPGQFCLCRISILLLPSLAIEVFSKTTQPLLPQQWEKKYATVCHVAAICVASPTMSIWQTPISWETAFSLWHCYKSRLWKQHFY